MEIGRGGDQSRALTGRLQRSRGDDCESRAPVAATSATAADPPKQLTQR